VVGLHPEGERHLGSEIPVVLDLMVSDLQLPHAATQINSLLVLGTGREKFSKPSGFRFLSEIADFFFVLNSAFSNCRMRLTFTKA
jgi:hypothetical protein